MSTLEDELRKMITRGKDFGSKINHIKRLNDELINRSERLLEATTNLIKSSFKREVPPHICGICFANPSNVALNCGHTYCYTCTSKLTEERSTQRCPSCRAPIHNYLRLFQ